MNQDALITEVAKRHGVALGNDDPVMILATLNEILAEENAKAQAEVLAKFQKDLVANMNIQTREAKGQLQGALRQSLQAEQNSLTRSIEQEIEKIVQHTNLAVSVIDGASSRLNVIAWLALLVTLINCSLPVIWLVFWN